MVSLNERGGEAREELRRVQGDRSGSDPYVVQVGRTFFINTTAPIAGHTLKGGNRKQMQYYYLSSVGLMRSHLQSRIREEQW